MTNPFYRLAPFIQDFIYRENWEELRPVQVDAIGAILDTSNHVLITSGTASGKTEAAFLPILTELYERPSSSIGAMYVGPLKALINDQFHRLEGLLEDSGIPVQSWHGDVSQSKKQRFLRKGQGILQITPESLEAMLINRQTELSRLFGDLRYVVLDEVHALIGSDRGRQVLCQLQRLARYQTRPSRRIGLSATLGEPELASAWLAGGTDYKVTHINDIVGRREVRLGLEHFIRVKEDDLVDESDEELGQKPIDDTDISLTILPESGDELSDEPLVDETDEMFEHMAKLVDSNRKTLIFANSRNDTEEIIHNLRRLAGVEGEDEDSYYVHHGSISAALRERAEQDMLDPNKKACVAATITLELGIDIGNLDQVLQLNATSTVSSFVQRLGRSGRRGGGAKMFFYSREDEPKPDATLGERIPWVLLQTIAIIQLYIEEKWIEPPDIPTLPTSILYHQTLSIITAQTELTPPELAEQVLSLSPFNLVSFDHFRELLRYLLEIEHLERMEGGGLIIGAASERLVNNYHFYATFEDETSYMVREGTREIGSIQSLPIAGDRFRLAGRAWKVIEIDEDKKIIHVERVRGKAQAYWTGGDRIIHTRILQRICRILEEATVYSYLHTKAIRRLESARKLAQSSEMTRKPILDLGGSRFMLLPWQGTREMNTIKLLLEYGGIKIRPQVQPFYLEAEISSLHLLKQRIKTVLRDIPQPNELIEKLPRQMLQMNKYDRYVPESLLRTAYCSDRINIAGAVDSLERLIQ